MPWSREALTQYLRLSFNPSSQSRWWSENSNCRISVKKYLNENKFLVTTADSAENASELIKIIKDKHFGVFKTQIFDTEKNLIIDGTGTALHEEKL